MENKIALNFLELTPKSFHVTFFSRKLELIPEIERKNYFIQSIKKEESSEVYEKFAIVFQEIKDFEKCMVPQDFNSDITKRYLLDAFKKHILNKEINYIENKKEKYNRIYFSLNTHIEGTETIWIEPYFLKQTLSFGFLIDYKFLVSEEYLRETSGPVDKRILQLSGSLDSKGYANKAYYQFKYEKLKLFFNKYLPNLISFNINNISFSLSEDLFRLNSFSLNPKIYQFHNEAENASPFFGLQKNSPFQNPETQTNFLFIFREADREIAVNLLNGLKGLSSPNTFPGIEKLFSIPFNNNYIKGKKVIDITLEILDEVVFEIKNERKKGFNVLPIIITNSKTTETDHKLYYLIKHTFIKNNIACQVVTKDLINNTSSLNWSLSNIGLQIFAKSGGKPWKVKPAIKECLIIGIGSKNKETFISDEKGNKRRKIEKYLTYSVLTDSSGLFKEIQILSETDNEEDYYKSLINKLNSIIQQTIKEGNKDIIIHTPFKISKYKVWDILFKTIPDDVNISILLINPHHKYFGYDFSKNALVPYESSFIKLSEYEYLVWFEGLQYNNAPFSKPIGAPIYINFWHTNQKELLHNVIYRKSLIQDCINLSGANWRGFKAKQLPVSIFYCQKIADFLIKFEEYEFEHIEFENLKPWFL